MRFDRTAYGARIKRLRLEQGLTQEELAEKLSVSGTYIGKIEKGQQTGPIELAVELAYLFDVTLDFLAMGSDDPPVSRKQQLLKMIDFLSELEAEL